jgi:hypothetical protein
LEPPSADNVAHAALKEDVMLKRASRAIARRGVSDQQDFVAWCATAMWALAAFYLLATFTPY